MQRHDVDVAIIGGGCAGLSLAYRLVGSRARVVVIEPRGHYTDDRTWSFWRTSADAFEDCVRARWNHWSVTFRGREASRMSSKLLYQTVSAQAFYDKAQRTLDHSSNVELALGTSVLGDPEPAPNGAGLSVDTSAGALTSACVIDTRPDVGAHGFGQHFIGLEVQVDGAVFDPSKVELMHFAEPRSERTNFTYVLPFAPDRALVEITSFAPHRPPKAELETSLAHAIEERSAGRAWQAVRSEKGFIPMQVAGAHRVGRSSNPRLIKAGIVAGAARPSTGYAFQRIQVTADQHAAAIRAGRLPQTVQLDSPFTRWMDGLFLRVLQRWPERAPELFLQLFRHAPADRLERFLAGSTAAKDRIAVIAALPPSPFLRELFAV